jgi:hypothetical protein
LLYWEDSRLSCAQTPYKIKGSPSQNGPGLPTENHFEKKLRSAALAIAVLVIFFIVMLALTALFWLLLTGLATLLALSGLARLVVLSGLPALLALSGLTLLALFFHIVCHEYPS